MAGDFDLSARITADASGLVEAAAQGERAVEGIGTASRTAAESARELESATSASNRAQADAARQGAANAKSLADVAKQERDAARAAVDAARERAQAVANADRIVLTPTNPTVTLSPGSNSGAAQAQRNAEQAAAANETLAQALDRAATAEAAFAARSRESAEAVEAARVAQDNLGAAAERAGAEQTAAATSASAAQQRVAQAASQLDVAESRAAAAVSSLELAHRRAAAASDSDAEAQLRITASLATAEARVISTTQGVVNAQARLAAAQRDATRAGAEQVTQTNRQGYAIRNVGQQFGDFGLQVAGGADVARAFGQQAGQLGYALSEMEGKLGGVGKFLTGPWGIALTIGAAFIAPLIEKILATGAAAEEQAKNLAAAAQAADSYGNAQSLLGKVIDLTTGKLKTQNEVLIQTIKLQARTNILAAQAEQKKASAALSGVGTATLFEGAGVSAAGIGSVTAGSANLGGGVAAADSLSRNLAPIRAVLQDYIAIANDPRSRPEAVSSALDNAIKRVDALGASGKAAGRDIVDVKTKLLALGTTLNDQKANQLVLDAINGKGVDPLLKPYEKPKKDRVKKPKSTDGLEEFGLGAADKIANIVGQFDEAPAVIDKTNEKVRELDRLIEQLNRRKPPNFEALAKSAEDAKVVVRDGLIREVAKAFEEPKTLADKAGAAVKQLDAVIADLAKNKPPGFDKLISDANKAKDVIRDGLQKPYADFIKDQQQSLDVGALTLQGRVDEAAALKTIQSLQKTMGPLTTEQKAAVLATTEAMRAQARAIDDLRQRNAKYIEAIGGIKTVVEDATQAFVRGDLGQLLKSPGKLLDVFQTFQGRALFDKIFGGVFQELEDQVNGTSVVKDASARMASAVDKASSSILKLGDAADRAANGVSGTGTPSADGAGGAAGSTATNAAGDIVVTGSRNPVVSSLEKVGTKIAGLFTNPESAANIGKRIGNFAGKGLEGAATGSLVSGVANAVGIKLNSTGAQLGGAVGNFLPIPGGSIIGSVLGGLIGNLFTKAKPGGATVSGSGGTFTTSATGSDKSGIATGKSLAGGITSGIQQIAQQLGGQLGSFNVSIGTYKGDLRVNENGKALGGVKNSGAFSFGDDESAAVAKAIQLAVAQGAVTGLSDAVQRALKSSSDIDKALADAVGVRNLESVLGGLAGSLKAQFDAEAAAGKERVRLAQSYGLDIVATEKYNDEQRAKLVDDTLKSRIGSLSDFLDNLKFGDLAEGSATDKRNALLDKIKGVQADAEAGKAGAADQLATLYGQLVQNSRDAFGTAGTEYSADRTSAQSAVERVIAMETDRVNTAAGITQAAQATTDAVKAGNDLTSETNDLLAQQVTATNGLSALLASKLGSGGGSLDVDYGSTLRQAIVAV